MTELLHIGPTKFYNY